MLSEAQIREQAMYDFFQQKALDGGITSSEFDAWVAMSPLIKSFCSNPKARFRKIVEEFAALLRKVRDGKYQRCFINNALDTSLYFKHIGLEKILAQSLGKRVFLITYMAFAPNTGECQITFHPEYRRTYNGHFYIYGKAFKDGEQYDIVNDCATETFTQLNINRITRIEVLEGEPFQATFNNFSEWEKRFEYVLGVDPIQPREPIDLLLYVKDNYKSRFENDLLSRFKTKELHSDKEGYSLLSLKIKQNKELERQLLSYGNDVLIHSPEKLRKKLAKEYKKSNEYYNG